jgi:hypothetical protein
LTTEYLNNKEFEAVIERFKGAKRRRTRYEMIIDDLQLSHEARRDESRNDYLMRKRREYGSVIRDYEDSQQLLAVQFFKLSENIVGYARYHHVDIDDAIQEGVMICFQKIDLFRPEKGKAFNYMTTCILNHYRQLYRTARNYNELKRKYHEFIANSESVVVRNGRERLNFSLVRARDSMYN